jgi:hypothetical protein
MGERALFVEKGMMVVAVEVAFIPPTTHVFVAISTPRAANIAAMIATPADWQPGIASFVLPHVSAPAPAPAPTAANPPAAGAATVIADLLRNECASGGKTSSALEQPSFCINNQEKREDISF